MDFQVRARTYRQPFVSGDVSHSELSTSNTILRGHGALDKAEQILEQSWSERALRGVERVRSPTICGATP